MNQHDLSAFHREQIRTFKLAGGNYAALQQVIYREIPFPGFSLRLQHNPARIISTNARVDEASIRTRPCFLCPANRPLAQKGIPYGGRYDILVNPYPIFREHFTVPTGEHMPQLIGEHFKDLLNLAIDYPAYIVFYNGPSCGASAPDHFHFQLAPRHLMPLEKDAENPVLREVLLREDFYTVSVLRNYLRKVLLLQASDLQLMDRLFRTSLEIMGRVIPFDHEPKINLLAWFDNCTWTVCLFPRRLRRPWQFAAEGKEKVLFSPGCVDMAGLIIAPREEDFRKYTASLLTDLFGQVCPDDQTWEALLRQISRQLLKANLL